jgi:hypothetical protein
VRQRGVQDAARSARTKQCTQCSIRLAPRQRGGRQEGCAGAELHQQRLTAVEEELQLVCVEAAVCEGAKEHGRRVHARCARCLCIRR